MNQLTSNHYTNTVNSHNDSLISQREEYSIFIKYHQIGSITYGCRFTTKRVNKSSTRYDCAHCRKIIDKSVRKSKTNKEIRKISEPPAYFNWKDENIKWVKKTHIDLCTLQEYGEATCRSAKNEAVIMKSCNAMTSKQAYDCQKRSLIKKPENEITIKNLSNSYKSFTIAKHALNKAHKRKNATISSCSLGDNKRIKKEATIVIPTENLEEAENHFLIYESPSGSVVLGTKFLIEKFFNSKIALSDGTFKIAVKDYAQTYILWYLIEDIVEGEEIPRNKAIAAVYFLMKTKSMAEYEELFGALELFR